MPTRKMGPEHFSRKSSAWVMALFFAIVVVGGPSLSGTCEAQTVTVLHAFTGLGSDGWGPFAPVIVSKEGTLYGTTEAGGDLKCSKSTGGGCGTIFQLKFDGGQWTYSNIYEFTGGKDGAFNFSGLTLDDKGNLYGATNGGPDGGIYRLSPGGGGAPWRFSLLYSFKDASDGAQPLTPLYLDKAGALYGVTRTGGLKNCAYGCGTVFQLVPPGEPGGAWTKKTLHEFTGGADGWLPESIFMNQSGLIYGTAMFGGVVNGKCQSGCGVVFRLTLSATGKWEYSVISSFNGAPYAYPAPSLVPAANGGFYGIAYGNSAAVFKITPRKSGEWERSIVKVLPPPGGSDVSAGPNGVLYGTVHGDQDNVHGTLFQLTPRAGSGFNYKLLWDFNNGPDQNPNPVVQGPSGAIYGTLSGEFIDGGMVIEVK